MSFLAAIKLFFLHRTTKTTVDAQRIAIYRNFLQLFSTFSLDEWLATCYTEAIDRKE